MMRKKSFCLIISILLLVFCAIPADSLTISEKPTDRFFVNDFANVIDADAENAIYSTGVQLYQKTGAQVVVVTVPSLNGTDIQEYGVQLGRSWGVGNKDENNGIVLLFALEEREVGISVGYGLEGAITDMQSGILLDHYAIPYFKENNFSTGLLHTYNALTNEVYLEYGMEADPHYTPIEELEGGSSSIILYLLLLILMLTLSMRYGIFPWLFFFPGGFHHRGGGFKGGGGSFGGGGASRKF